MKVEITFRDEWDGLESLQQYQNVFLEYLNDCVHNKDVTGFNFYEIPEKEDKPLCQFPDYN